MSQKETPLGTLYGVEGGGKNDEKTAHSRDIPQALREFFIGQLQGLAGGWVPLDRLKEGGDDESFLPKSLSPQLFEAFRHGIVRLSFWCKQDDPSALSEKFWRQYYTRVVESDLQSILQSPYFPPPTLLKKEQQVFFQLCRYASPAVRQVLQEVLRNQPPLNKYYYPSILERLRPILRPQPPDAPDLKKNPRNPRYHPPYSPSSSWSLRPKKPKFSTVSPPENIAERRRKKEERKSKTQEMKTISNQGQRQSPPKKLRLVHSSDPETAASRATIFSHWRRSLQQLLPHLFPKQPPLRIVFSSSRASAKTRVLPRSGPSHQKPPPPRPEITPTTPPPEDGDHTS